MYITIFEIDQSPDSMHETGCSVMVHWEDLRDGMGREVGGGSGWGMHVHPWWIHVNITAKATIIL